MSHKRNEALRHVQHSMHHVIAAGEGSDRAPDSCKLCPYYRPDFKFRTCLYAHCPDKKQVNVFRSTPEKWDILYACHVFVECALHVDGRTVSVPLLNEKQLVARSTAEAAGKRCDPYRDAETDRVPQKEQKNSRRCLPVSGGQRRRMGVICGLTLKAAQRRS